MNDFCQKVLNTGKKHIPYDLLNKLEAANNEIDDILSYVKADIKKSSHRTKHPKNVALKYFKSKDFKFITGSDIDNYYKEEEERIRDRRTKVLCAIAEREGKIIPASAILSALGYKR